MIGSLVVLVFVGGIVAVAMKIAGRSGNGGSGPSDGAGLRRFFQYVFLYGLLIVAASGLTGLIARIFDTDLVRMDGAGLARSVTFTVIGIPLYVAVAWWSRGRLAGDPGEARSLGWAFYVTAAAITALIPAMVSGWGVLSWVFGHERWDGGAGAGLVVWGGVWAAHWIADRRVTPPGRSHLHLLAGSIIGLSVASVGLARLLIAILEVILPGLAPDLVISGPAPITRALVVFLVGSPVWVWYWLASGSRLERTGLWRAYVLLAGVGGGLATAIVSASVVVFDVLVWFIGRPTASTAIGHFDALAAAAATAATGLLLWWYHRTVLRSEGGGRTEAGRVYEYLMAAIGLLAAASGLTTVLVALIEALVGSGFAEEGTAPVNTLLAAVTLLIVGGPVWWVFWRRIQRATAAEAVEEVTSPTRRVYLFVLFGLVGLVAIISLLVAVFIVFEAIFETRLGAETVRSMRVALGILVTGGAMAAYHWSVYKADRLVVGIREHRGPSNVVLVGPADDTVVAAVASGTGARVQLWRRAEEMAEVWSATDVVEAVRDSEWDDLVVILGSEGLSTIPIDRS